jgi:hypothetical protein
MIASVDQLGQLTQIYAAFWMAEDHDFEVVA